RRYTVLVCRNLETHLGVACREAQRQRNPVEHGTSRQRKAPRNRKLRTRLQRKICSRHTRRPECAPRRKAAAELERDAPHLPRRRVLRREHERERRRRESRERRVELIAA